MSKYTVVPMFWGSTFPHGNGNPFNSGGANPATTEPYSPEGFTKALRSIAVDGYFSKLRQYGAEDVSTIPPIVSTDPWPASDTKYYVATFTSDQVVSFIQLHMNEATIPNDTIPIFAVIIPAGSLLDVNALGAHSTFQNDGNSYIWFWTYGSNSINDVCQIATHEIVESIGADFGVPAELCDECNTKKGGLHLGTLGGDRPQAVVALTLPKPTILCRGPAYGGQGYQDGDPLYQESPGSCHGRWAAR